MLLKVKQQPFVTFVGVPGSGKTATARHIALLLKKEGYAILPITDKSKIETYCDPCNLQVFVIDDVFGIYKFDSTELDELNRYKDIVVNPVMQKTKILMTCRETVFRHKKLSNIFLTKQENVILLQSEENALTDQDKRELFAKYQIDQDIWKSASLASSSYMFPLLCKLFSEDDKYKVYGLSFFISPVPCILKELDSMKRDNEIQYVSLILLMVNQNKVTEDMFRECNTKQQSDFNEIKGKLLEECQVPYDTDGYQFINALSEMEKTYTSKCGNEITFINDSLFEITACHFGRQCPEIILQYMSCDFIANNVKVDTFENDALIRSAKENENDRCIRLQEEKHHKLLAKRLAKDLENGELHSVFKNEAMKHSTVLRAFIEVMEKMKFKQLYSIFLSNLKSENQAKYGFNPRKHLLNQAFDDTDLNDHIVTVRAITWIIYYGHHQILQYIIAQCLKEEEEVGELYRPSNRYVFRNYEKMKQSDKLNQLETSKPDTIEQFILLCIGSYCGCLNIVQVLLKYLNKYAILNERHLGSTPLVIACKLGYSEIANELVKAGADINLDDTQVTPLLEACQKGHLCVVETLISLGANVNLRFEFRTPLTVACQKGYFEIVKKLIQSEADINLDNKLHTPLTIACEHGHARVVEELIHANSNVNLNGKIHTPLSAACQNGHVDIVETLINAGASVNLKCKSTPLIIAVQKEHLNIVDKLINAKADVNQNDGMQTPLIVACEIGCLDSVTKLIQAGADVNFSCALYIPLTAACKSDACKRDLRLCVVQELLNRGADVNLIDGNRTPLTYACFQGYLDIVETLIKAGARLNQQDKTQTPLTTACWKGHESIVEYLIEKGADLNQRDKTQTPLTTACWNGHLDIVKHLITHGADVNLKDETRTPLTASCKRGHVGVVDALINAKAKVNLSDGEWTPLTAASSNIVTEKLLNAGAVYKCRKLKQYFERDI